MYKNINSGNIDNYIFYHNESMDCSEWSYGVWGDSEKGIESELFYCKFTNSSVKK